jgi:hypothetical protein
MWFMPGVTVCPTGEMEKLDQRRIAILNSLDGAFSDIVAVTVGRHQLILNFIGGEKVLQSGRCLIVESLEVWFETLGSEFLMDVIIGLDPFRGGPGFHRDEFNVVAVINIADHDR